MNITLGQIEFFFAILVRISSFILTAPFFSHNNVPRTVKAGLSFFLAVVMFNVTDYVPLEYDWSIEYAVLIIKEVAVGATLGFTANLCLYILEFAGGLIDTEIGFSMVNVLNPATNIQTTITGSLYTYLVMLIMMVTRMHYFLISAIADTFRLIPIQDMSLPSNLYLIVTKFIREYFIIGFRIVLPVFASILVINVVLGVLARVAPQMNMFVIGMQLKLFVGLIVLCFVISMIPSITDFIFQEMKYVLSDMIEAMAPK